MATQMSIPQYKLNLGGTEYTYGLKASIVKLRENNYSTATLVLDNYQSKFYNSLINTFTEVKLYFKDASESTYTQVFGGYARELLPTLDLQGELLTVGCKGYGAALEETHCNRDYGTESANIGYPQPWNIWTNIIAEFVNKSFADWDTNHSLTYTEITDAFATDITYINNPYRPCIDVINHVCDLTCAIEAGADAENPAGAGAHWIVNSTKRFLVGKIGKHTAGGSNPAAYWPDWWNTDQAGSTLVQGTDFLSYQIIDKSSEFANNVVLATVFRRPAYDAIFTENNSDAWGAETAYGSPPFTVDWSDNGSIKIVGSYSLQADLDDHAGNRYGFYPATKDAGWDVTRWGSNRNPPRLNFYIRKHGTMQVNNLFLFTTDYATDYYELDVAGLAFFTDQDDKWTFHSIPIGPYHATIADSQEPRWVVGGGSPSWSNINGITFYLSAMSAGDYLLLDDMHFSGQVVRSAYVSDNITANKEWQKIFISRSAMDDSCVATDDTGDAGRIAKAELLRRIRNPVSIVFTTPMRRSMMAGQKLHVHAGLKVGGAYAIDSTMRAMTVEHNFDAVSGATTTVTATDDLYNTRPISSTDRWALQQEFTLVNSAEAKNIRAGAEVDLLIPILKKNYT